MCQKHRPVPLFDRPADAQFDLRLAYLFRGHAGKVRCAECGLTGVTTHFGNVRWYTPGRVGFHNRTRKLAEAIEWNQLVADDAAAALATVGG